MRDLQGIQGTGRGLDALRLVALSRIPRCASCPRFHALYRAYESSAMLGNTLPTAPAACYHQVCDPLVQRFAGPPSRHEFQPAGLHGAA